MAFDTRGWRRAAYLSALAVLCSCSATDGDSFPYALSGLDAWVYDNDTQKAFFAGRVEANYFGRKDALAQCAANATTLAASMRLRNWGYVCCTVTAKSDCATKVR